MSKIIDVIFFIVTGLLLEHIVNNKRKQEGLASIVKKTQKTFDKGVDEIKGTAKAVGDSVGEIGDSAANEAKGLTKSMKDPLSSIIRLIKKLVKIPVSIAKVIADVAQDPKTFPVCILPGGVILIVPYLAIEIIKTIVISKVMFILRIFLIPGEARMKGISKEVLIKKYERGVEKNVNKLLWYMLYAGALGFYTVPLFAHYIMSLPWKIFKFFTSSKKENDDSDAKGSSDAKEILYIILLIIKTNLY